MATALTRRIRRPLVRMSVALLAAVVAGTALVLGLSAALDVHWDPRGAVILALAAVWIPQTMISAARHRRH
ncbi:MAG TPA: hypothetical protein VIQ30_03185 [Pseudonocardia sp.]